MGIKINLKESDIKKVSSDLQKAFHTQTDVRLDSNESMYLAKELQTVSTNVLAKKYADAKYMLLPQLLETGSPGNRTISLPIYDSSGGYTVSDDVVDNTKEVGMKKDEQIVKVKVVQNHAKWDIDEMQRAAQQRIPLSTEKLMLTRKQWEWANSDACYNGLTDEKNNKVSEGLFDYFYHSDTRFKMTEFTGISNSGSGSTKDKYLFANKTAAVIISEMLKFIRYAYESSDVQDYATTHVMIPLGLKTILETTAWSSGSDRNILEYLAANTGVVFQDLSELNAVTQLVNDTTHESAMIAYKSSNEYIAHVVAEQYNLSAPVVDAWKTRVETKGKVVGGVVREPKAVIFAKGIYKNP